MERLIACTALQTGHVFLTRVGRHCGAESVTVAGLRSIKIMGKKGEKPRQLDHALTAWMAADSKGQERDLLPFGWILRDTIKLQQSPELPGLRWRGELTVGGGILK